MDGSGLNLIVGAHSRSSNAHMALSIADRGYVLETGRLAAEGKPEALWSNDDVRAAYLGGRSAGTT